MPKQKIPGEIAHWPTSSSHIHTPWPALLLSMGKKRSKQRQSNHTPEQANDQVPVHSNIFSSDKTFCSYTCDARLNEQKLELHWFCNFRGQYNCTTHHFRPMMQIGKFQSWLHLCSDMTMEAENVEGKEWFAFVFLLKHCKRLNIFSHNMFLFSHHWNTISFPI